MIPEYYQEIGLPIALDIIEVRFECNYRAPSVYIASCPIDRTYLMHRLLGEAESARVSYFVYLGE